MPQNNRGSIEGLLIISILTLIVIAFICLHQRCCKCSFKTLDTITDIPMIYSNIDNQCTIKLYNNLSNMYILELDSKTKEGLNINKNGTITLNGENYYIWEIISIQLLEENIHAKLVVSKVTDLKLKTNN